MKKHARIKELVELAKIKFNDYAPTSDELKNYIAVLANDFGLSEYTDEIISVAQKEIVYTMGEISVPVEFFYRHF